MGLRQSRCPVEGETFPSSSRVFGARRARGRYRPAMAAQGREARGDNPFQAALLSIAVVLIAIGVLTFGIAASKAVPTPLYPDAAVDALPSLIWGGSIIAVGAVSFLFWLLVSAVRWNALAAQRSADRPAEPSAGPPASHSAGLVEAPRATEVA